MEKITLTDTDGIWTLRVFDGEHLSEVVATFGTVDEALAFVAHDLVVLLAGPVLSLSQEEFVCLNSRSQCGSPESGGYP